LRLQVHRRELGHLPGPEDQHVQAAELAEDLFRQRDRGVADRDRPLAETCLAAHPLADAEGRCEQAVGERAGRLQPTRGRERVLDLPEDLRLTHDERVEPRRDAEQMVGGLRAAINDDVRRQRVPRYAVVFTDEAAAGFRGRVRFGAGVDLRAVAGRKHDRLAGHVAGGERREGSVEPAAREVHALPKLHRRRPVTDPYGKEAHRGIWKPENLEIVHISKS
jgi:hypothetical protein